MRKDMRAAAERTLPIPVCDCTCAEAQACIRLLTPLSTQNLSRPLRGDILRAVAGHEVCSRSHAAPWPTELFTPLTHVAARPRISLLLGGSWQNATLRCRTLWRKPSAF